MKKKLKKKARKRVIKQTVTAVEDVPVHQTKIKVVGIGGGAASIISEIAPDVRRVDFIAANTDTKSLREVRGKVRKFQFGLNITKGLGTGMNDEIGEAAAHADKEKIKKILENQDLCIIVACLGGGTSSGASHVFAKISKNLGNLTYGIFTLPFEFEGGKKMEMAQKALDKIRPNLNAYSVIPNERVFQVIDKNTPLKSALSNINKRLAENLEGLIEMIYLPGLVNIDFADLRTVLSGRGRLTYLNTTEINGQNKEEAIKRIIYSPLYPYSIKGSKGILYNINGSNNLQLAEVAQISKLISEFANKQAKIIFGINQSKKYQNKIRVSILATGCDSKGFFIKKEESVSPVLQNRPKPVKVIKKAIKLKRIPKKKESIRPIPLEKTMEALNPKIRRNGLQLKKIIEQEEKELIEQEKTFETPAILRKNK